MNFVIEAWVNGQPRALRVDVVEIGTEYDPPRTVYQTAWSTKEPDMDVPVYGRCVLTADKGTTFAQLAASVCMHVDKHLKGLAVAKSRTFDA